MTRNLLIFSAICATLLLAQPVGHISSAAAKDATSAAVRKAAEKQLRAEARARRKARRKANRARRAKKVAERQLIKEARARRKANAKRANAKTSGPKTQAQKNAEKQLIAEARTRRIQARQQKRAAHRQAVIRSKAEQKLLDQAHARRKANRGLAARHAAEQQLLEEARVRAARPKTFNERIAARIAKKLNYNNGSTKSITAYYTVQGGDPIWINKKGWLPSAKAVAREIRKADSYGLNSASFKLPNFSRPLKTEANLAAAELMMDRAVVKYARHAAGGRVSGLKLSRFIDRHPKLPAPVSVLQLLKKAKNKAAALRAMHPVHPQFLSLKKKLASLHGRPGGQPAIILPAGPALRLGVRHPQVALLRKRLNIPAGATPNLFNETVDAATRAYQADNGLTTDGVVGSGTRGTMNGRKPDTQIVKVLINMERWRKMPKTLAGKSGIYVWANVPEFRVRIVRNGKVAFSERSIVGLLHKQTPIFSDKIEWIEFHPTWFVPNSIKVEDILPSLKRPTSSIVSRYHLQINCGAAGSDPRTIDWSKTDIRRCKVTQPAGPKSVLGDMKFKFPNKHAVYMHDTLTRRLFNNTIRTYSHGCIRIKNPQRMAEILLDNDKGISRSRIDAILRGPRKLYTARFKNAVPVHITYLTAFFNKKGAFVTRPDFYGHDRRLAQAMFGKGHLIAAAPVASVRSTYRRKPRPARKKKDWTDNFLYN